MKTLDPGLAAHFAGGATTLCFCWLIVRKDATVMGFTDHDRDVVFDGVTYQAKTGFVATQVEDQLGLAVSNLDVQGALSSAAITEDDLNAGRWDDAAVTIYKVNWADTSQRVIMRKGFLGQVTRGTVGFTVELRGLASRLDQTAGRVFQRTCPWTIGDSKCKVDLTADGMHGSGTVTQAIDDFDFVASGLDDFVSGWFSRGKLTWTSGANDGLSVEVKSYSQADASSRFSLFLPVPDAIEIGDTFDVTAGCDWLASTCTDKFSNIANFGGFPHMPGNDFIVSVAKKGSTNDGSAIK